MAIRSFPYMSIKEDNKITASNEAERIDQIVDSGIVFDVLTSFECKSGIGPLDVKIAAGSAIIKGHAVISDAEEIKTVSEKDTNPRIDLIVLESNTNADVRAASIKVIKGTPDLEENLVEPSLSGETGVSQIKLAKVFVPASGVNEYVTITDLRTACLGKHNHLVSHISDFTDSIVDNIPLVVNELKKPESGFASCMVDNMYANGIINGDFQVWSNGTDAAPDRWEVIFPQDTATITKVNYNPEISPYAMRVKLNEGTYRNAPFIKYALSTEETKKYRGKKVTFSFSFRGGASVVENFRFFLYSSYDAGEIPFKSTFKPTTAEKIFTFTTDVAIPIDATQMHITIDCMEFFENKTTAGANWYLDITNVNLSATDFYVPFSPKSYNEEVVNCYPLPPQENLSFKYIANGTVRDEVYGVNITVPSSSCLVLVCTECWTTVTSGKAGMYLCSNIFSDYNAVDVIKNSAYSGTVTMNNNIINITPYNSDGCAYSVIMLCSF